MTKTVHDHSSLSTHQECARKFYYNIERRLESPNKNVSLVAGDAVHEGLDVLYKSEWDLDAAIEAMYETWNEADGDNLTPENCTCEQYCKCKSYLSGTHLEIVLRNYAEFYEDRPRRLYGVGSELFSERSFKVELDDGLVVGGIIDRLEQDKRGNLILTDVKTSSLWSSYWWSKQAKQIDHQLRLYWLALEEELGVDISKARIDLVYVGEKATEHFDDDAWDNRSSVPFDLSKPITFSPGQLEETRRWIRQVQRDIEHHREAEGEYERDEFAWPQNVHNQFGCTNCPFYDLCRSSPVSRDGMIRSQYEKREESGILKSGAD